MRKRRDSCPGKRGGCIHLPVQDFQRHLIVLDAQIPFQVQEFGCSCVRLPSGLLWAPQHPLSWKENQAQLIYCNIHGCGWEKTLCPLLILPPCGKPISLPLSVLGRVLWVDMNGISLYDQRGFLTGSSTPAGCSSPGFTFCNFPALYLAPDFGN